MKRYTHKVNDINVLLIDEVKLENGFISGEAIDRLSKFESFYEDVERAQTEISLQLETLRNEGKEKTVQFRELFTKKLVNNNVLAFLRFHGLADKKL
jgi:hypothetical protein